jgi:phosphoglycerate dehydrogenase-like enzyme
VPNTTLTPHSAGMTREAIGGLGALVIGNVRSLLTGGELRNIVTPG